MRPYIVTSRIESDYLAMLRVRPRSFGPSRTRRQGVGSGREVRWARDWAHFCFMNVFRHQARAALHRVYSTTARPFVPPAQLHDIRSTTGRYGRVRNPRNDQRDDDVEEEDEEAFSNGEKPNPSSGSFYTGRSAYYDNLIQLEKANGRIRHSLKTLQLLPLPDFARASLLPLRAVWKNPQEMSGDFNTHMTTSRYRRITALLNETYEYYRIATTAGAKDVAELVAGIVGMFESGTKDAFLARGKRKKVELDAFGRSYTFGKRKTSAARVWMIGVQEQSASQTSPPVSSEEALQEQALAALGAEPKPQPTPIIPSTILVNNMPLAEYFPLSADRERVVRPLKVAGVLGKYNVFVIARGGGTTGQSGAIAHGIAKGILAHDVELGTVLKRGMCLRFFRRSMNTYYLPQQNY